MQFSKQLPITEHVPEKVFEELSDHLHSDYTINNRIGKKTEDKYGIHAQRAFQNYVYSIGKKGRILDLHHSKEKTLKGILP